MSPRPDRAADFEERCQALGVPLTLQRRAILEVLLSRKDHPTADEVAADLASRIRGISRATVYRTLETLVGKELLARVCHPGAATRYELRADRHHHLVCDRCGKIVDFEAPSLDRLRLPDLAQGGFQVRDFSVHVRGLCKGCGRVSNKGTKKQARRKNA